MLYQGDLSKTSRNPRTKLVENSKLNLQNPPEETVRHNHLEPYIRADNSYPASSLARESPLICDWYHCFLCSLKVRPNCVGVRLFSIARLNSLRFIVILGIYLGFFRPFYKLISIFIILHSLWEQNLVRDSRRSKWFTSDMRSCFLCLLRYAGSSFRTLKKLCVWRAA